MDYERVYGTLIEFRKANPPQGYCEKHHILPRSLGGSDDPENLVKLTAREHFIAHLLLTKIHKSGPNHFKMVKAINMMRCNSPTHERYIPSRTYDFIRRELAIAQSICQSGEKNSQFGTVWVFHDLIGSKRVKSENVPELIEQGWFLGKRLKTCKVYLSKEQLFERNEAKLKIKYPNLEEWYELYSTVGFEEFVKQTGYKYSKPNLVNLFSRHVKSFKPQNGKKRKK